MSLPRSSKERVLRSRHVPQRTCFACHNTKAKRELIRLVRTPSGAVEIDLRGEKTGRGAYLCPKRDCWELGLKKNRLEYVLRAGFTLQNRQALLEYGQSLPQGEGGG